jgi:ketosteroid isomerase-like protein
MQARERLVERIRRGYRALGPGAHRDVAAMLGDEGDAGGWVVRDVVERGREWRTREVAAMDLFAGLPAHWELIGVDVERWLETESRLLVQGHYRSRPRASGSRWHVERSPFAHVWRFRDGRVDSVYSYLEGVELRRLPAAG